MIVVERAPPYLTVQDAGRTGFRDGGVPTSGAMDQWALSAVNNLVGNPRGAAALEWALGAGSVRFESDAVIALAGAEVEAYLNGSPVPAGSAVNVAAGQSLTVHRLIARRFVYVGIRGGVDCPVVLGSRSTYLPAALGGIGGRRLATDDVIPIGRAMDHSPAEDHATEPGPAPDYDGDIVRMIAAVELPRDDAAAETIPRTSPLVEAFLGTNYTVSLASDRTGYRLEGNRPLDAGEASIVSEPVCAGTIQLPPGGHPIVLMADSPTIGGYRILGTVITRDLPVLAQSVPGRRFRFARVSVGTAQDILRGA